MASRHQVTKLQAEVTKLAREMGEDPNDPVLIRQRQERAILEELARRRPDLMGRLGAAERKARQSSPEALAWSRRRGRLARQYVSMHTHQQMLKDPETVELMLDVGEAFIHLSEELRPVPCQNA